MLLFVDVVADSLPQFHFALQDGCFRLRDSLAKPALVHIEKSGHIQRLPVGTFRKDGDRVWHTFPRNYSIDAQKTLARRVTQLIAQFQIACASFFLVLDSER